MSCTRPTATSLVEPNIIQAPVVVEAIVLQNEALYVGLPAQASYALRDDGSRHVLGKLLLDIPDELSALGEIGFVGLRLDQLLHIGVAILGVVALRTAGVVLVEVDIGVVDGTGGEIHANRVLT